MEPLSDPKGDRVVNEIDPPPAKPISDNLLFPNGSGTAPDWRVLKSHIFKEGRVTKEHCLQLIRQVSDITHAEPNLLRLAPPVTVVGDIHGQFYDFVKLLDVGGDPDKTQYLFLGDYVDRGSFSIEVLLLLYALKSNNPKSIWLLRGNHECRQMTAFFNFRDECEYKYDLCVYNAFMESFDTLPIAAVIDNKFLCVHGGLSPDLKELAHIGSINRVMEPPRQGIFCDLLWADPLDEEKPDSHVVLNSNGFAENDVRGCSYFFGFEASSKFLQKNHLLSVIRAHEAQLEGYKMHQSGAQTGFPTVITIFSAPNYCDVYNNKGAVVKFEQSNTLNIQQFNFSPHPYHLPNFMDVFTWSIPFVSEKVTEMLYSILNPSVEDFEYEESDSSDVELPEEVKLFMRKSLSFNDKDAQDINERIRQTIASSRGSPSSSSPPGKQVLSKERAEALRKKVQSIGRLMRVFRTLRQQNELIVQLKGITPGHRIPPGALLKGEEGLKDELQKFQSAKKLDLVNERRPES